MKKLFFYLAPFLLCKVTGNSMYPTYKHGERVVVQTWFVSPAISDVIVFKDPRNDLLIVKRVVKVRYKEFFVAGDNKEESTDSRMFGWVQKKRIVGKVIFPKNTS